MNYSKAIRIIRAARGLTQKELSERAKLNPGYISRIEKGTRQPTQKALDRISKALDAPLYLMVMLATDDSKNLPKAELAENLLQMLLESEKGGSANAKQSSHPIKVS